MVRMTQLEPEKDALSIVVSSSAPTPSPSRISGLFQSRGALPTEYAYLKHPPRTPQTCSVPKVQLVEVDRRPSDRRRWLSRAHQRLMGPRDLHPKYDLGPLPP